MYLSNKHLTVFLFESKTTIKISLDYTNKTYFNLVLTFFIYLFTKCSFSFI